MSRARVALVCCVALTLTLVSVNAKEHHLFWDTPTELPSWRLPTQTRPLHYDIHLAFPNRRPGIWGDYRGSMNITVEFMGPDNSMARRCFNRLTHHKYSSSPDDESQCLREGKKNQIIMHADRRIITHAVKVYKLNDKQRQKELKIVRMSEDKDKQLIAIDLAQELPVAGTKGVIEFDFELLLPRPDMHGIYKGSGYRHLEQYTMITAMFQPSFARLAMPCFDEPEFKATFSLKLSYPTRYKAFANTPELSRTMGDDDTVMSKFKQTPPMSVHMFAFTIGDYDEPLELQMRDNLKLRAITPLGKRESGHYALEVAKFAIERFEKYIGYEFPLEKLDIVALPDIDKDNAETWGLVFIRDKLALIDDETKPDSKITTAVNVAHVVVHQWFANLITAEWWDDLWITEGVAAQKAFELVSELFSGQSDYFVRISTLSGILALDSSGRNHSLSPPESELMSADQSYDLFDNIEFMKSGALTRLLQNLLGYEEFRTVLQQLVRANAYGSVNFGDLLGAISTLPKSKDLPIEQILTSWSKLKSYPIINVDFNNEKTKLVIYEEARPTAKPFLQQYSGSACPCVLPLSVLIVAAADGHPALPEGFNAVSTYRSYEKITLCSGDNSTSLPTDYSHFVASRDYVKVSPNPDLSSYYRVRYSDEVLQTLKEPVQQRRLPEMDRLHLLDDSRALFETGFMGTRTFRDLLSWYTDETSSAVLIEMLLANQTLSSLGTNIPSPVSDSFIWFFRRFGFRVSGDETLIEQRARMVVLKALVAQGVQEVIEAGAQAFNESEGNITPFLREPVYAAVVAAGNFEQMEKMLEYLKMTDSHEEQMRLASALALSQNGAVLDALTRWLIDSDLNHKDDDQIWDLINISRRLARNIN